MIQKSRKENVLTWTPSTLSTNKWPLFLLIKSAVIESEYEFNVAGTSSNGELLCSILRHRLIVVISEKCKKVRNCLFWKQNCCLYGQMCCGLAHLPTKAALVARFKIISINGDDTRQYCSRTQNCCNCLHCVRMGRQTALEWRMHRMTICSYTSIRLIQWLFNYDTNHSTIINHTKNFSPLHK